MTMKMISDKSDPVIRKAKALLKDMNIKKSLPTNSRRQRKFK